MRQTAVGLYALGTLVLVYALFATGTKPDKLAVLAGGVAVLTASVINISLRRGRAQDFTTTDWLRGKRRGRRNPAVTLLSFLALLVACFNALILDSPYSGARHYFVAALVLMYVTIIGFDLFNNPYTPYSNSSGADNTAPR